MFLPARVTPIFTFAPGARLAITIHTPLRLSSLTSAASTVVTRSPFCKPAAAAGEQVCPRIPRDHRHVDVERLAALEGDETLTVGVQLEQAVAMNREVAG